MEELESQIAKIELGNNKTSSSFVYIMAEKAPGSDAELYMVAELPLLNPAAEESSERICLAIGSALKRSYRRPGPEASFENAISQINDELAKLASIGQTQWVDKLNCILSVKEGLNFHIATCGKVSAYLMRNYEFTDISCSPEQSHPLKTFENYASGKIRLGDLLVLSTTQLFNYLSMDRVLDIFSSTNFLTASQTILELLKGNAESQVSFAVLLNLQVPFGQIQDEELDLENYQLETGKKTPAFVGKFVDYFKNIFALSAGKDSLRKPKTELPKVSLSEKFKGLPGGTKDFMNKGRGWLEAAKNSVQSAGSVVKPQNFQGLSKQKKFLLASILVLLIAVIANIFIASRVSKTKQTNTQLTTNLNDVSSLLSKAQDSLLYKDNAAAANFLNQAKAKIPAEKDIASSQKDLYNKVEALLTETENKMEKVTQVKTTNLGSLGQSDSLIKVPNYLAVQIKGSIISYNLQNGKIEDSSLRLPTDVVNSVYTTGNSSAIYNNKNLYIWDFSAGTVSPAFSQSVPQQKDFGGIAEYPTNNRVYIADKGQGQIISFLASKTGLSKPVVTLKDASINQAVDITIDSSIYVLTPSTITKFTSGQPASFTMPALPVGLSGKGKIYTQKDFLNLYVLDSGNKRILILDKKGTLLSTLTSSDFTNVKDFQVDEKNKTIYVLNDGSLLKITLP
jgi:hypothetical protein